MNTFKSVILAIGFIILSSTVLQADIAIEPLGTSYHWDRDKDYNENNEYIGIVYRYDQYDFTLATFKNSRYDRSNIASVGYRHMFNENFGAFASVGYVTGYSNFYIFPAAGLYVEYEDFYVKLSANQWFAGIGVGYIFRTF